MKKIDSYGKSYQKLPYEKRQADIRRQLVAERVSQYPHIRMLEIGCGMRPFFADFNDFQHMTIVEPCLAFAAAARQFAAGKTNVEILPGFLEEHAAVLRRQRFDIILAGGLLHEIADPKSFMTDIASIAGARTVVHINVPNAHSFHRLLGVEMKKAPDIYAASATQKKLRQPRVYDMESLHQLAADTGFRVVADGSYAFKPFTHAQMEKLINIKFLNKHMQNALAGMVKYAPKLGSEIFADLRPVRRIGKAQK